MSYSVIFNKNIISTMIPHGIIQFSFGDLFPKVTSLNNFNKHINKLN